MSKPEPSAMMTQERRKARSESPYQAAELYLGCLRGLNLVHAAAVADRTGLPLAGIGDSSELELLALWGTLTASQRERYETSMGEFCRAAAAVAWHCPIGAGDLWVSAIGAAPDCADVVARDLRRILAPLQSGPTA